MLRQRAEHNLFSRHILGNTARKRCGPAFGACAPCLLSSLQYVLYCGILFRAGHLKICSPKVRGNEKVCLAFAQDGVLSDASFHRDLIIPLPNTARGRCGPALGGISCAPCRSSSLQYVLCCGILFTAGHPKICAPKVRCNEKMRLAFAQDGVLSDASFHRDLIIPLPNTARGRCGPALGGISCAPCRS